MALPQPPAPLDGVDEVPIANSTADVDNNTTTDNNNQDKDSNHSKDSINSQHNNTTNHNPNNNQPNIDHVSDSDTPSSLNAGIGLWPIEKPGSVVVKST
jgi:hypothetical protein